MLILGLGMISLYNKIKKYFDFKYILTNRVVKESSVMLTHQDADCAVTIDNKKYPHHIGSIIRVLVDNNISFDVINAPDASFYGDKHYYNAKSYNSWFLLTRIISKLLFLIGLNGISDWAKSFYWLGLLKKMKVKIVIGIQPHPGLCIAARKLNIPVFDYQHGVIDRGHWWYDNKAKIQPIAHLPTDFLCWDSVAHECLSAWVSKKGISVHIIGNLWIYRFLHPASNDPVISAFSKSDDLSRINILVTLQPNLHKYYYKDHDFWVMPESLRMIISERSSDYNWFIRLHPIQLLDENKYLVERYLNESFGANPNVDWVNCTQMPLPMLLSTIDMHITDMSTVVLDADYFNIPSALMSLHLNEGMSLEYLYKEQRIRGGATLVGHDYNNIKEWICNNSKKNKSGNNSIEIDLSVILSRFGNE